MATVQTSRELFNQNFQFQAGYYSQIQKIITDNVGCFVSVEVASPEADMKRATDFVVRVMGGDIAVRIRRADVPWRDLTVRSYNNGNKTEIHKLREGFARFYLYGWTNTSNAISEWALMDLDKIRALNLLENRTEKPNKDGRTRFICIPLAELRAKGCIVAEVQNART